MATNTLKHISDNSAYKTFNPAGTSFPANITNVQAALAAIKPIAVNGVPFATQTVSGISRFGTQAEVDAGVLSTVGVSPLTLKSAVTRPQATTTVVGLTRYATDGETTAGTINNAAVVPSSLKLATDAVYNRVFARNSTETQTGVIKISTQAAAKAGTDDTTAMTPKKVAQVVAAAIGAIPDLPTYSNATTSVYGFVKLATPGEAQAGTNNGALAINPATLASVTATEGRRGLVELATTAEVNTGTDNTRAITPASLGGRLGTTARTGLVKLSTTVGSGDANTALAYNANVVSKSGNQSIAGILTTTGMTVNGAGNISGNLTVGGTITMGGKNLVTTDMLSDDVPIGTIVLWGGQVGNIPTKWRPCDGKTDGNSAAFNALVDTTWGSYGARPDFRGLFPRGAAIGPGADNVNQAIKNARPADAKGKPGLGANVISYGHATIQAQMTRKHKHVGGWGENFGNYPYGATFDNRYAGQRAKLDSDNYGPFTNDGTEVGDAGRRTSYSTLNTVNSMGDETRPWSMSVLFIIKVQ